MTFADINNILGFDHLVLMLDIYHILNGSWLDCIFRIQTEIIEFIIALSPAPIRHVEILIKHLATAELIDQSWVLLGFLYESVQIIFIINSSSFWVFYLFLQLSHLSSQLGILL